MESTGVSNKIQASEATANLLIKAGKENWVTPREDMINAKGKGVLRTFWLKPKSSMTSSSTSTNSDAPSNSDGHVRRTVTSDRHDRAIDWVVELFKDYIKPILARHMACKHSGRGGKEPEAQGTMPIGTALIEVKDVIDLPSLDLKVLDHQDQMAKTIEFDARLSEQIRHFVTAIASLYLENPFHNFEHAW